VDRDELIGVFKYALQQLDANEDGITENNQLADLNATAALCLAIKALAVDGNTLEELCLRRLAALTEDLLVAPWAPTGPPSKNG
jgi:hypothetical protein